MGVLVAPKRMTKFCCSFLYKPDGSDSLLKLQACMQLASVYSSDGALDASQATYEGTGLVFESDGSVGGKNLALSSVLSYDVRISCLCGFLSLAFDQ